MRDGRTTLGLSLEALGKKLGVSFQQVQKYESGVNRVSAARLFEICRALKGHAREHVQARSGGVTIDGCPVKSADKHRILPEMGSDNK
jgi:transcriptional regulator with XRE-family HTH domain